MRLARSQNILIVQDIGFVHPFNRRSSKVRETNGSNVEKPNNTNDAEQSHATQLENAYQQQLEGNWKQFSGRVKEAWGVLTDDDVDRAEGKLDQLAGTIEEKTGEARATIARKLNDLASSIQG